MAYNKLFEQVEQVRAGSDKITTALKPESPYMVNRFLSLEPRGFIAAYTCNSLIGLPDWAALPFLKFYTPNLRVTHKAYPKKGLTVKKLTEKQALGLSKICRLFNVSEYHGRQVMVLLEKQNKKFW